MQDSKDYLTEYSDFKDYLQKNLSWYEYENLWKILGFKTRLMLGRMIAGSSITNWSLGNLLELVKLLENPILPSKLIERFDLLHKLSDLELEMLDNAAMGFFPNS